MLFMYGTIEVFRPLYALQHKVSTLEIGGLLSTQIITLALTKPSMGKFSDRHGRTPQIVWGSALGVDVRTGVRPWGYLERLWMSAIQRVL